ncbi:hypothetical protein CSKR_108804 [Clonorchis sinensis]|uniref:Uncharacterized protein n=1 Tax=Clonorchis sinensis TaxID=79923 RepID=A0A3R7DHV9_CLOSI|nr:hypothetical protein CSKR_108804 [Clonorchis sinensis]
MEPDVQNVLTEKFLPEDYTFLMTSRTHCPMQDTLRTMSSRTASQTYATIPENNINSQVLQSPFQYNDSSSRSNKWGINSQDFTSVCPYADQLTAANMPFTSEWNADGSQASLTKRDSGCYVLEEATTAEAVYYGKPQTIHHNTQDVRNQCVYKTSSPPLVKYEDTDDGFIRTASPWTNSSDVTNLSYTNPTGPYHSSVRSGRSIPNARKQHQREQDKNRTRSLNVAFCRLRACLPEIPKDTKLTKIRTLRYAISYIRQLMDTVDQNESVDSDTRTTNCSETNTHLISHKDSAIQDSGFDSLFEK